MSGTVVTVEGLRVELTTGVPIVEDVSFQLGRGDVLGLVGESGSGKTTTALALLGYARPGARIAAGSVHIAGQELVGASDLHLRRLRGRVVSYVPQEPAVSLNPSLRIGTQVLEVARARGELHWSDVELSQAFARVHLPHTQEFLRRFPHQLSGGQQQRVILAIAFAMEPAVVVLDEPTTGLDVVTQRRILMEIARLRDETHTAMVYVSHDLAAVATVSDHIAVMYAGRIVELGETHRLLREPMHPYTYGLIASVPDHVHRRRPRGIRGVVAAPDKRSTGCTFAPRCEQLVPLCIDQEPELLQVRPGRLVRCTEWARTGQVAEDSADSARPMPTANGALLQVEKLWALHSTAVGHVTAARDVSFAIAPGEALALVGESGSGKTTIARCIAGLHPPAAGSILFDGKQLPPLARKRSLETRRAIQLIFQSPYESLSPRQRIGDQIARPARQLRRLGKEQAKTEVTLLLASVRLPSTVVSRFPAELSGGERQRVAIARALAAGPRLLVCDEITSALDVSVQAAVLDLITELRVQLGLALLFISHDLGVVASVADRALVLENGDTRSLGTIDDILTGSTDSYTRALVSAAVRLPEAEPHTLPVNRPR